MTHPIELLAIAQQDMAVAREWYCRCHPDLETDLILCVDHTLARITDHPFSFPRVKGEFRQAFVHRFPYRVVYRMVGELVIVVAILHTSRDPLTWINRNH